MSRVLVLSEMNGLAVLPWKPGMAVQLHQHEVPTRYARLTNWWRAKDSKKICRVAIEEHGMRREFRVTGANMTLENDGKVRQVSLWVRPIVSRKDVPIT
jgi:hypothetical protein